MSPEKAKELAEYVLSFLQTRNRGELQKAFDDMRMGDYLLLLRELTMIFEHGGKPPNWIS